MQLPMAFALSWFTSTPHGFSVSLSLIAGTASPQSEPLSEKLTAVPAVSVEPELL